MKKKLLLICTFFLLGISLVYADLPFRNHRYDGFKVLKVKPENIVFIGNSITNMHEWWEAFDNHNIINRGVSGAVSDEILANLESMIAGNPKKVFLMVGTNDLGTNGLNTTAHVAGNIRRILERIQKESPQTEIYVQSILPSRIRNIKLQKATNDSIQKICIEKNITYIDLWDALFDVTQNNNHTLDGLHLTASGYRIWCKAIAPYVGSDCVYPDQAVDQTAGMSGSLGMRASYFGMLPVKEGDVLMIGDEMLHGGEWHELLNCKKVKNRGTGWGYPGATITNVLAEIPVILKGRSDNGEPSKVFLYVGAADANGSTDLATLKNNYQTLVSKIREQATNTKIYIQALLPTSNAATNSNRVVPFNTKLKEIANSMNNVEYVDIYTPMVENGVANNTYFKGNYVYGKGYAKLSQIIAPLIGNEATAINNEQATAQYDYLTARNMLGATITSASSIRIGNGVGEYTIKNAKPLLDGIESAYTLLKKEYTTTSELTAETSKFNNLTQQILPAINKPQLSTEKNVYWYKAYTPLRDNRYLTSNGAGQGTTGENEHNYAKGMWKFMERADGTWNIVNRADGSYLNPSAAYNTQISTSVTVPASGWELSYASTPGMFIIKSGTVQLNQTNANAKYAVYNWSGGNSGVDRTDAGCQYSIIEAGEPEMIPTLPIPLFDVKHITLDGTAPYCISNATAAPVLAAKEASTIVIDYTASSQTTAYQALIASANTFVSDRFYTISTYGNNFSAVYRTEGASGTDQYFTHTLGKATDRHQLIIVTDKKNQLVRYYVDGTLENTFNFSLNPTWRMASLGDLPGVNALYLGGLVTSDNENKWPFIGNIHSIRIYPDALSEEQIELIEYVAPQVETPNPILTLTNIRLDGAQPYLIPEMSANPVLNSTSVTVAIDFTPTSPSANACVLVGSSCETDVANFFSVVTRQTSRYGVQYIGNNKKEGWYTHDGKDFSKRNQMVITMNNNNQTYTYYMNGTADRTVSNMGEYGFRTFGNVPNVTGLFLGGLITADNPNKNPFTGTIHSIRFWDKVLTAEQVSGLVYEDTPPTEIKPATNNGSKKDTSIIYNLSGCRVNKVGKGVYIMNRKKLFVK